MKNRKWIRVLCAALTVCLLTGLVLSVGAWSFVGDVNGDGRITAFDAQMIAERNAGLRTLTEQQQTASGSSTLADLLNFLLGRQAPDAGDTDCNGVIEIYTAAGLQQLYENLSASYILMSDLDLEGADWVPVVGFAGSFDGNGKTISNVNITESTVSCLNSASAKFNMGFFGDTRGSAVISGLHLRNVTVTATEEALYMGLLLGSNRGQVTGCTATGTIIDTRPSHSAETNRAAYIGVLAGRICSPSTGDAVGNVIGGTAVSISDEQGNYTTTGLCADARILLTSAKNINPASDGKIGVVGWAPSAATVSGIWSDSSNSSDLLSDSIQQRQDIAVDYMNTMGSVAWTPSETLVYTANPAASYNSSKTFTAGVTYYGLPYNHHNGSYERFLSAMASQDENGVYTTVTGLGDSIYSANENGTGGYDGFVQLMGNDCSTSVSWAWMQISPTRVNVSTEAYAGGVCANRTRYMVPNDSNRETYGVYPVGTWTASDYDETTGKWTAVDYDPSLAAYPISTERSTEDILMTCGEEVMLEAYAQTHKADALVRHRADPVVDENGEPVLGSSGQQTYSHYGHCRMVAADPVVIRKADGTIDGELSYFLTTEQGSSTGSTSTWKVNYRRTFAQHMTYDPANPYTSQGPYLPLTIRALRDEAVRDPYVTQYYTMTGPTDGKFYSNYRFSSITLTVTDADGSVFYDRESFTGISFTDSTTRGTYTTVTLAELHGEAFAAAAAETGMVEGQTYYYAAVATLSNGTVINLNQRFLGAEYSAFTYTAPAE